MRHIKIITLAFISLFYYSCGNNPQKGNENSGEQKVLSEKDKQLNITFLLDLSDRIEPSKYPNSPEHYERDIADIGEFVSIFKNNMHSKGNIKMIGKMRVLFNPAPKDPAINQIAKKLDINTSAMKPVDKKELYKTIQDDYAENLSAIYEKTLKTKDYIGSDIWRFFKNDVKDLAIDNNPIYRNILVVITDGYIYHEDTKFKEGNRMSYILPQTAKSLGLTKSDWKEKIDKMDFGLIAPRKDLDNLEVLMLEINPSKNASPYEEDILSEVLSKWLSEMGVKKFEIYKTDIPQTTKKRIENFMKG